MEDQRENSPGRVRPVGSLGKVGWEGKGGYTQKHEPMKGMEMKVHSRGEVEVLGLVPRSAPDRDAVRWGREQKGAQPPSTASCFQGPGILIH